MPFDIDTNARDERRGPIWAPFAVIRDNLERLVIVNLAWSIQLLPGVLALAFPELPGWTRMLMILYSATVLVPGTGVLYAMSMAATNGDHLSFELAKSFLRELTLPSFRCLGPLYGVFGVLIWLGIFSNAAVPSLTTLATLIALLWTLCAIYWGPMLVHRPHQSAVTLAGQSIAIVWRHPDESLATGFVSAVAFVIGLISIGGFFLIVPVVITLLHSERYLALVGNDRALAIQE
jgi:hypothetical protein